MDGPPTGGSLPVTATATVTAGGVGVANQPTTFLIGGGCTPASATVDTNGSGDATQDFTCPVGVASFPLTVASDGVNVYLVIKPS